MPDWIPEFEPQFEIDQTVYYIRFDDNCPAAQKGERWKAELVQSIKAEVVKGWKEFEGKPGLICRGYRLQCYNFDAADGETYLPYELYDSLEEVKKDCRWFPVELSDNEWMALAGARDPSERYREVENFEKNQDEKHRPWIHHIIAEPVDIEESEIGVCCAGISAARDLLIKCSQHGGLIYRDVRNLVGAFHGNGHGDMIFERGDGLPILQKVMTQLPLDEVRKELEDDVS